MEEPTLCDVFSAFAGGSGAEMDGRGFVKCLRDSRLLDGQHVKAADADIIFAKCKTKGARRINFDEFCACLAEVATRRGLGVELVVRYICDARGPDYETGSTCASLMSSRVSIGPERLFYDKASYTGVHKKGGPSLVGGGLDDGDVIQDYNLVHRGFSLQDGLHRSKVDPEPAGIAPPPAAGPRPLPMLLGKISAMSAMSRSASAGPSKKKASDPPPPTRARRPSRSKSPRGPERFFYDRSTYTGTHRHGGPSIIGNGLPKEPGYDDLRDLVNRAHVQDDALHRRKEREASPARSDGGSDVVRTLSASVRKDATDTPQMYGRQLATRSESAKRAASRGRSALVSREPTEQRSVNEDELQPSEGTHSAVVPRDLATEEAVTLTSPAKESGQSDAEIQQNEGYLDQTESPHHLPLEESMATLATNAQPPREADSAREATENTTMPPLSPKASPAQEIPRSPTQEIPQRPWSVHVGPALLGLQPSTSAPMLPAYSPQLRTDSPTAVAVSPAASATHFGAFRRVPPAATAHRVLPPAQPHPQPATYLQQPHIMRTIVSNPRPSYVTLSPQLRMNPAPVAPPRWAFRASA